MPRVLRYPMFPGNCAILHGGAAIVLILRGNGVICIARVERKNRGRAGRIGRSSMVKVGAARVRVKGREKCNVRLPSLFLCPFLNSLSAFNVTRCLFCPSCLAVTFQCPLFCSLVTRSVAMPKSKNNKRKKRASHVCTIQRIPTPPANVNKTPIRSK